MLHILEWLRNRLAWLSPARPVPPETEPVARAATRPGEARPGKQAVIIVHGMGEQRPMDTIKGFVRSIWEDDPAISVNDLPNPNMVWSKPDARTGSLELRRITTRESIASRSWPAGVRTDFYELYWADLTAGSTWAQFSGWVRYLLFRRWSHVPNDVRSAWILLWAAAILVVALGLVGILPKSFWPWLVARLPWLGPIESWQWLIVAAAAATLALLHKVASKTFGRVVRYTRADPDNIAARAAVRERGLKLLRALHRGQDYSRIVVVGHSLGAMLAYDLLAYYWSERTAARMVDAGSEEFAALCAVERSAARLTAAPSQIRRNAYRKAQSRLRRLLARRPPAELDDKGAEIRDNGRWLISDFVTLGSPLTHAEFLIASDIDDLADRIRARELPTCPPYREALDPEVLAAAEATASLPIATPPEATRLIAFPDQASPGRWGLHHGAPFAVVRWTNLYDPARFVLCGDMIGGPIADTLGSAIVDVDLRALRGQSWWISHTGYWRRGAPAIQLEAVRCAVNLLDR